MRDLVDIVSKNGNMLLNVGPKADGSFCEDDVRILKAIGAWMKDNGEAIYGTRPWRKFGEGPTQIVEGQFSDGIQKEYTERDFRFTTSGDALYVFGMRCSDAGDYYVTSLGHQDASRKANFHGIIRNVKLLGSDIPVTWSRDEAGLHLHADVRTDMPVVFKVTID